MKTMKDLEEMKTRTMPPFDSEYDYLFETLEDYYIAKMDGMSRIKRELSKWDRESASVIVEN